jgi:hypothetical protein
MNVSVSFGPNLGITHNFEGERARAAVTTSRTS